MGIIFMIVFALLLSLFMYAVSKRVELEEPMEIIVARRICKLKMAKNKKECKIKELNFMKNKRNVESNNIKIQALKIDIIYIKREIEKLKNYGKIV